MNSLGRLSFMLCKWNGYRVSVRHIRKIVQETEGDVTKVHGEIVPSDRSAKLLPAEGPDKACPLCRLNMQLSFMDVLILRQFMRDDGSVLPRKMSGLCAAQQQRVERLVMQAHWSGLFPTMKPKDFDFKEASRDYKKFNRYWEHHADMYSKKLTVKPGSFYYIKRY